MNAANSLKTRLARGGTAMGSWITLGHPAVAEIMARAGFHWAAVDMEHSVISMREAAEIIRVLDLCGCAPLPRLSSNDPSQAKRLMDAGAHGVIVPMVNSREEAVRAVDSVRYPPAGKRGVGLARAQDYGHGFQDYRAWLEEHAVVVVQIEHIKAVENLADILAVDGVDGFLVGPYDLSGSLGVPGCFDHPDMAAALAEIRRAGAASGKAPGIHVVEPDPSAYARAVADGFRLIAYGVDIRMLDTACRAAAALLPPGKPNP